MTDKLDPGWVNDRLPTEEDADKNGDVIFSLGGGISYREYQDVSVKEYWCKCFKGGVELLFTEILSPQECLDREKGEEVGDGLIKVRRKQMENDVNEAWKKVKDLEKDLAKEQADHVQTKERLEYEAKRVLIKEEIMNKYMERCEKLNEQVRLAQAYLKSIL